MIFAERVEKSDWVESWKVYESGAPPEAAEVQPTVSVAGRPEALLTGDTRIGDPGSAGS